MTREEIEAALAVLPTNWVDMDMERVRALRALLRSLPVLEAAREWEQSWPKDKAWDGEPEDRNLLAAIREHDREGA